MIDYPPYAFPQPDVYHANGEVEYGSPGMTLRDYFAAKTIPQIYPNNNFDYTQVAATAYAIADAMLAARERKEGA